MDKQIEKLEEKNSVISYDRIDEKWSTIREFITSIDRDCYYRENYKWIKKRRTREYIDEKWFSRLIYNYLIRHIHFWAKRIYPERDDSTFRGPAFLSYYNETYRLFADELIDNWDFYEELYGVLADAKSKCVLTGIALGRLTGKKRYFGEVADPVSTQYFDEEVVGHCATGELFVDIGGFDGESTEDFFRYSEGVCDADLVHSVIYELDPQNMDKIRKKFEGDPRVDLRNKGLSDETGSVYFESGSAMSKIVDYVTGQKADIVTLDDDLDKVVTYMKMDVEGAEGGVLRGAKRHIEEDVPRMAICVYHKPDDIRAFYTFVKSINPAYKFYLRQYMPTESESVLYAIPE